MEKKNKKKETAIVMAPQREMTPQTLISQAITQGVNVETMEKLMNLQDRWESKQAKKAFDEAMAKFQSLCPTIKKDKAVNNKPEKGGGVRYKFAPLDSIVSQVKRILQECGFSYTIQAEMNGNLVTAICKVTHSMGHSQESSFQVPTDPEAYMNAQQKFGAALTFAKRYAFCNAFGIMTGDEDVDANAVTSAGAVTSGKKGLAIDQRRVDYIAKLAGKKDVKGLAELRQQIGENPEFTNQDKMYYMGLINDHLKALEK